MVEGDIALLNKTLVACLGPVTADYANKVGLKVDIVAKKHTMEGLVEILVERYKGEKWASLR